MPDVPSADRSANEVPARPRHISELRLSVQVALVWGPVLFAAITLASLGYVGEPYVHAVMGWASGAPLLQQPNGHIVLAVVVLALVVSATAFFCLAHLAGLVLAAHLFPAPEKSLYALAVLHDFPSGWYRSA